MKYLITNSLITSTIEYDITQEEFNSLKKSKEYLDEILAFEEKYDLLISNYLELEIDSLIISQKEMIYSSKQYENFFEIRQKLNQRIANLLTSTRMYIDQVSQHIKKCDLDFDKNIFAKEYDNFFEYRFMEALRNYVQHRGLALHLTTINSKKIADGIETKMNIYTKREEIISSDSFKSAVSEEMPAKVDLLYASRIYIESINNIHLELRVKLSKVALESRNNIEELINKFNLKNKTTAISLNALCKDYDQIIDHIHLTLEWDNIRIKLEQKNQSLEKLSKSFVTNNCK